MYVFDSMAGLMDPVSGTVIAMWNALRLKIYDHSPGGLTVTAMS